MVGDYEVETPVLHNEAGGAGCKPFITHHNRQTIDVVLLWRLSSTLKRLIVGGMGTCLRNRTDLP